MKLLDYKRAKSIFHIIGIGGIGMSAIAQIMHKQGFNVQGSDLSSNYNTEKLENLGIKVFAGHQASNIEDASYVIISSAIKETNPDLIAAREKKKIIIKRSEILAELMRNKIGVSISGTHGKTTTTSLAASLFESANLDPTVITGGIINNKSTNGYVGNGDFIIVEADESDATFVQIPSQIAVITNIEAEHLDFYGSFERLFDDFRSFIANLPFYGFAVVCIDDANTRKLAEEFSNKQIITYGIESLDANLQAINVRLGTDHSVFDVKNNLQNGHVIKDIRLAVSGVHNVLNSLAIIAIGMQLNLGEDVIKNALCNFSGVKRRFTKTGEVDGVTIIDDYAHHPTEIRATLANARNFVNNSGGKVIAIFQPHRYSRLQSLFKEFTESFDDADFVYVTEIYSAGEEKIEGLTSGKVTKSLIDGGKSSVFNIESLENLALDIKNKDLFSEGDIVVFMGAGDITKWAYNFVDCLRNCAYVKEC